MATEGTAKVRRIADKLNKVSDNPGAWLVADALKTLCQEIEKHDIDLTNLETHVHQQRVGTAKTEGPEHGA